MTILATLQLQDQPLRKFAWIVLTGTCVQKVQSLYI